LTARDLEVKRLWRKRKEDTNLCLSEEDCPKGRGNGRKLGGP